MVVEGCNNSGWFGFDGLGRAMRVKEDVCQRGPERNRVPRLYISTPWNALSKKRYFSEYREDWITGKSDRTPLLKEQQGSGLFH